MRHECWNLQLKLACEVGDDHDDDVIGCSRDIHIASPFSWWCHAIKHTSITITCTHHWSIKRISFCSCWCTTAIHTYKMYIESYIHPKVDKIALRYSHLVGLCDKTTGEKVTLYRMLKLLAASASRLCARRPSDACVCVCVYLSSSSSSYSPQPVTIS